MVGQRSLIMLAPVNAEEAVPRAVATIPQALARFRITTPLDDAKNYQIDRGNHWSKHQRRRRDKYTGGVCLVPASAGLVRGALRMPWNSAPWRLDTFVAQSRRSQRARRLQKGRPGSWSTTQSQAMQDRTCYPLESIHPCRSP